MFILLVFTDDRRACSYFPSCWDCSASKSLPQLLLSEEPLLETLPPRLSLKHTLQHLHGVLRWTVIEETAICLLWRNKSREASLRLEVVCGWLIYWRCFLCFYFSLSGLP
jgi:hypothetical protein